MRTTLQTWLIAAAVAASFSCGKSPIEPVPGTFPLPTSPPTSPPTPPTQPVVASFHISGVVIDEGGQPLPGIVVLVNHIDHFEADGKLPTWVRTTRTTTDAQGRYQMDIEAIKNVFSNLKDIVGLGVAFGGGGRYLENDVQFITSSTSAVVRNFRIDRYVDLAVGESATVEFRPDATLCVEWVLSYGPLCRYVGVAVPVDGTLTVSALPLSAGAAEVFLGLLNALDEPYPVEPGYTGVTTVSYPVRGGTVQAVMLQIPSGSLTPRLYRVTTALRTETH